MLDLRAARIHTEVFHSLLWEVESSAPQGLHNAQNSALRSHGQSNVQSLQVALTTSVWKKLKRNQAKRYD